jgi:hypothetical protein
VLLLLEQHLHDLVHADLHAVSGDNHVWFWASS